MWLHKMAEELSAASVALLALAGVLFILVIKSVYRFKKELNTKISALEQKTTEVEAQAATIKQLTYQVQEESKNKVDVKYIEKRIDGLLKIAGQRS